jgi:uncharacterized protein DUF4235
MTKLLFLPFSIAAGYLGGVMSKKLFAFVWRAIDDQQPPTPERRDAPIGKLVLALAFEGAVFRLTRGLIDHGARGGFAGVTGSWPGEGQKEHEEKEKKEDQRPG